MKTFSSGKSSVRGFSILEVLLGTAILAIILVAIISFAFWLGYANRKAKADRDVAENAKRAIETMAYEVRGAKGIYTPTTSNSQLSLETARYVAAAGEDVSFIDFFLCGGNICLKKESQNPISLLPSGVTATNLVFTQIMNGTVPSVKVTLAARSADATTTITLNSTVSLRVY